MAMTNEERITESIKHGGLVRTPVVLTTEQVQKETREERITREFQEWIAVNAEVC